MSLRARFTSRPRTGRARGAARAQVRPIIGDRRAGQLGRDPDASVDQAFAKLDLAFCQPAVLQQPDRSGAPVIALDRSKRHEQAAWNDCLDDLDLGLLAEKPQLVLWLAGPT